MSDGQEHAKPRNDPAAFAVLAILMICVVLFIWGSIRGNDTDTDTSTKTTEMIRMQGSVIVFDQRTCANGPMLRISAGARGPMPLEYRSGNAPCRLLIDTEIEKATQYKFEIRPLPPVIRTADELRKSDGSFQVDVSLRP